MYSTPRSEFLSNKLNRFTNNNLLMWVRSKKELCHRFSMRGHGCYALLVEMALRPFTKLLVERMSQPVRWFNHRMDGFHYHSLIFFEQTGVTRIEKVGFGLWWRRLLDFYSPLLPQSASVNPTLILLSGLLVSRVAI